MAADRYTKAVLTVIAICLVWLSLGGPSLLPTASAQSEQRVILAGWLDPTGNVRQLSPPPGTGPFDGPLPVFVSNR
jgi:hypothetical protein